MEQTSVARIMLAGTGSGCGKTTVTCAVLEALRGRGKALRAFKCGPDYIDPMFHTRILGVPCRNLDSFLCDGETVKYLFARNALSHCTAVIEGVMGYYDGLSGTATTASSHHIAELLDLPVILVMEVKGKSLSLAAELQGFLSFRPNRIRGVILNGVNAHSYPMYRKLLEENTPVEVLGYLPRMPEAELESRHLGLVTVHEVADLRSKMQKLGEQAERTIDLDRLLALAGEAGPMDYQPAEIQRLPQTVRIGIARDDAFCFYYRDSLDLLEMLGAKLVPFSPVSDSHLPPDLCGLLLGGGYPELYARKLAYNRPMLTAVWEAVQGGMPVLAECGGFLYLCRELTTREGETFPMAGALDVSARMTDTLGPFGYVTLTARRDSLLTPGGGSINAHEFHYSRADLTGMGYTIEKANGKKWQGIHSTERLHAGYPHMHLWGNPAFAKRFLETCAVYKGEGQ